MRRLMFAALLAPLFGLTLLAAPPAVAQNATYTFAGTCNDCNEIPEPVVASLVLNGYLGNPDTAIQFEQFVSFTYTSSVVGTLTFLASDLSSIFGDLSGVPGPALVDLAFSDQNFTTFVSFTDGTWNLSLENVNFDQGVGGNWSLDSVAAPEPASLALLGAALAGLGLARRRRG